MTSPIDRSASERVFTNQWSSKTASELKALMHKPQAEVDPYIRVRRSSIVSLKSWAQHRKLDQQNELSEPQASFAAASWDGFMRAIDEVLEMEAS